ncbi:SDR family NAD(P)-dependent oxidoreductase [Actinoplanes sp. NPDC023801]|uniref:SDR family NAD(P)-dependent oxidoreductase n=1 Tax=Actinoplanes sp. NPDC023801 TaxID=3154595 RepID=UPI0033C5EF15
MGTRLDGRTAIVTGATAGIGRAIAEVFAAHGASVLVVGRDAGRAGEVVDGIKAAGGDARAVLTDLRHPDAVDRVVTAMPEPDILVHNAGVYPFRSTPGTDPETFDAAVDINLRVPFFLTAALAPGMVARGHGKIVNITTIGAYVGTPVTAAYGATKAGLELLTRAWAAEFGPHGVNVNAVAPGPTDSFGMAGMRDGMLAMTAAVPAGRPARPEEVAAAALYLAGPDADYLHGTTITVDGGRTAT